MVRTLIERAVILCIASALLLSATPAHATDCSALPGTREATASDDVVKNGQIAAGTCYNPNDAHIGTTDESSKSYLKSLPRTGSATDDTNIAKLNDAFAMCAAKFLKDFSQRYGPVTISSAYRSPAYDAAMCRNNPACGNLMNNPNPTGNHQRGLAMDVWQGSQGSSDNAKIRDFAMQNPQYGVCFPFSVPGTGFYDRPHMILAGGPGSEGNGAGCRGVTRACDGSNFNPNEVTTSASPIAGNSPVGTSAYTGGTNANPFANPYNPTQQNQMCMISTDPIVMVPCNQQPQQYPMPQTPYPTTPAASPVQTGTSVDTGMRFSPSFPLPTPNTTSYAPPSPYTYSSATGSASVPLPTTPAQSTTAPVNTSPVRTTAPTQLNSDLNTVTNLEETSGYVTQSDLAINSASEARPDQAMPRTTETFTRTEPTRVAPPVPAATSSHAQNSIIIAALTALRNLLVSYVNLLKTKSTVGFQGPWQLPVHTFEY